MKEICLDDWCNVGEGATAESYYHKTDETLMLKLFTASNGYAIAEKELIVSGAVAALGFATPKILEMVTCNGKPAIIYEKVIDKVSFSRLCADDPEHIEEYGKQFAVEWKRLHSTECNCEVFNDKEEELLGLLEFDALSTNNRKRLKALIEQTKKKTTCLHGDMQPGNLVRGWCRNFEGREKDPAEPYRFYFIDLGAFAYGNPLYDLGAMYFFAVFSKRVKTNQELLHMNKGQLERFWNSFAREYLGTSDEKAIIAFEKRIKPYAALFALGISIDDTADIRHGKKLLVNLIINLILK